MHQINKLLTRALLLSALLLIVLGSMPVLAQAPAMNVVAS